MMSGTAAPKIFASCSSFQAKILSHGPIKNVHIKILSTSLIHRKKNGG